MIQIKNKYLIAQINPLGAEVRSVKNIDNNHEYMWDGDISVWSGISPVLFPTVGESIDGVIKHDGRKYPMIRHGFARHSNFEISASSSDSVTLSITTTADNYPFYLLFNLTYSLDDNKLVTTFEVVNLGDEDASCGFGAHPAFACPFDRSHQIDDYEITFDGEEHLNSHPISPEVFYLDRTDTVELSKIPVNNNTFDNDALVYSGFTSKKVRLAEKNSSRYVEVKFDGFEYLGLWAKPKAEYVCIEPWCGRADTVGFSGDISDRIGNVTIPASSSFSRAYSIEFGY